MNWKPINLNSEEYKCIQNPNIDPKIEQLYVSGSMPDLENSIAVVGSRKISEYGRRACREFVSVLAGEGITIISGLMYGVDLEAHNAAIDAGGKTIGVLGYGYKYLSAYGYASNLHEKIISNKAGAVVTEFSPDDPPAKWTFPKRNRIISALSKAVLVVEASEKSGSLITAGYGVEQGKDVFAIPGSIFSPNSEGTNWIIKQGANIATSPDDILMYFNKTRGFSSGNRRKLEPQMQKILDQIEGLDNHANIQKLSESLSIPIIDLSHHIAELELTGFLKRDISGRLYVLN